MDTEERIFQRIDKFEERLDDTCTRIEKIDTYITLDRENSERKFNRSVSVLGAIIGVIGLISILDYIP